MEKTECEHKWDVVVMITVVEWDDFMRYRGDIEDSSLIKTNYAPTHTLMCKHCKEIKKVN